MMMCRISLRSDICLALISLTGLGVETAQQFRRTPLATYIQGSTGPEPVVKCGQYREINPEQGRSPEISRLCGGFSEAHWPSLVHGTRQE